MCDLYLCPQWHFRKLPEKNNETPKCRCELQCVVAAFDVHRYAPSEKCHSTASRRQTNTNIQSQCWWIWIRSMRNDNNHYICKYEYKFSEWNEPKRKRKPCDLCTHSLASNNIVYNITYYTHIHFVWAHVCECVQSASKH